MDNKFLRGILGLTSASLLVMTGYSTKLRHDSTKPEFMVGQFTPQPNDFGNIFIEPAFSAEDAAFKVNKLQDMGGAGGPINPLKWSFVMLARDPKTGVMKQVSNETYVAALKVAQEKIRVGKALGR